MVEIRIIQKKKKIKKKKKNQKKNPGTQKASSFKNQQ